MATATIQFVYSATTINPPTPDFPEHRGEFIDQSIQQAMGGRITSITRGSGLIERPILIWNDLDDSSYQTMKTFFLTTVGGAANAVAYTDWVPNSAINVKYLGGFEEAEQIDYDSWRLTLRLAKV
jgi:hypothetical protein